MTLYFPLPLAAQEISGNFQGGSVKIGYDSAACDSSRDGAIRYNSSTDIWHFCNGSAWSIFMFATVPPCPAGCSIHSSNPLIDGGNDNADVELGIAFMTLVPGQITAIKFYKFPGNTGTHTAHLWDDIANLLATKTFSGETSSGWQTALLTTPVSIQPYKTYIASYWTTEGNYADDIGAFVISNSPLLGISGRFAYGANGSFPYNTITTNYGVDIVFVPD